MKRNVGLLCGMLMHWFFSIVALDDGRTLAGDEPNPTTDLQIFIYDKYTVIMSVSLNTLVDEILQRLKRDPAIFYLIYQGRPLQQGKTLGYYKIEKDATLQVSARVHLLKAAKTANDDD